MLQAPKSALFLFTSAGYPNALVVEYLQQFGILHVESHNCNEMPSMQKLESFDAILICAISDHFHNIIEFCNLLNECHKKGKAIVCCLWTFYNEEGYALKRFQYLPFLCTNTTYKAGNATHQVHVASGLQHPLFTNVPELRYNNYTNGYMNDLQLAPNAQACANLSDGVCFAAELSSIYGTVVALNVLPYANESVMKMDDFTPLKRVIYNALCYSFSQSHYKWWNRKCKFASKYSDVAFQFYK